MKIKHSKQVKLTKNLLLTVRHAAYATVNEDGTPHNSPLMLIYNDELTKLYIGSKSDSLHIQNMLRTGNTYVVLFDSFVKGQGGVYITGRNAHQCRDEELVEALKWHNKTRAKYGSEPIDMQYYKHPEPAQRMYAIDITKIEHYSVDRNSDGLIVSEARAEIDRMQLASLIYS